MGDEAWHVPVLEIHVLGSSPADFVSKSETVDFVRFIRPERKFASIDDLKRQIAADCATIGL